ncbi:ABC transporter ATP-binding protein [Clostridium baratii]|uniref:ABC transporter ATP-binding protein n=1 Tax=Clostridium baratii TaxID=1561 RepID=UPI0029022C6B|nr:ABC transporter ATP-binding protein [Clostridium baratii]MDU1053296.1 ABC transporter ATP-binding protein [Clostridium baratii]
MKDIIVTKNLYKEYLINIKYDMMGKLTSDKIVVLKGIDFTIKEGEFISIMGPSGAGKSTFMNLISTIDTPSKGTVIIDGENVKELTERKLGKLRYEKIGFVFQEFNLIDGLTVRENIAVPLTLKNVPLEEIDKRVEEVAKRLSIDELLNKYPSQCSGGQIQRVAISRVLVAKPKIIIADEPTGNLDSKNSNEVMKLFKELNERDGITVLMVTHDSLTASFAHKVLYIKDGIIEKTIEREGKKQREFFEDILKISSEEMVFED